MTESEHESKDSEEQEGEGGCDNRNKNDTVRYGGEHLLYDIKQGHLTVLMTTHEARRLATQNTASGNDLRRKAIHDT